MFWLLPRLACDSRTMYMQWLCPELMFDPCAIGSSTEAGPRYVAVQWSYYEWILQLPAVSALNLCSCSTSTASGAVVAVIILVAP